MTKFQKISLGTIVALVVVCAVVVGYITAWTRSAQELTETLAYYKYKEKHMVYDEYMTPEEQ